MKLKRVKIFGFKTFADKTEFDLDGDIIAVIGPNGCGKSNIVDSILWGLGETNARNLRAQTSKEVIFSGSGTRKGQGYAEVTLLFDNEDGTLPIDSSEVSVSRRLTRAGDSDYAINKRNCRLRDVNDLLADSGLGRAGYAIVSQSDIDQALSASAQQRRAWIDEAAGVQRYRLRRTESVRRLEHAEEHLTRVKDIISEIEQQMLPLEMEAETAKRYKGVLNSLREVETGLLIQDLVQTSVEIDELEQKIAGAMKLSEGESLRAQELEENSKLLVEQAHQLEVRLELLRENQTKAQGQYEQAVAQVQVAEHRLHSLDELEKNLDEESGLADERIAAARADLEKSIQEQSAEQEALDRLKAQLGEADGEAKVLAQQLEELEKKLRDARVAHAERQKRELEAEHRKSRLRQAKKELLGIVETLPDLESAVAEAEAEVARQQTVIEEAKAKVKEAQTKLAQLQHKEEERSQKTRQLLAKIAILDGRRKGIEATIDAHEGLAQGSRAVLMAAKEGMLPDSYVPVGEAITVDSDLAQAIDIALGGAANDLIVEHEGLAKQAIHLLKEKRLGRATFQPVSLMRPFDKSMELRRILTTKGVVGLASELVDCDARCRPVIDSLLGRVVIVEELDTALHLAKTKGWSRLVTIDGEVVFSSGAVSGGASHKQGAGLVQRKAELDDIVAELHELQDELEDYEKRESFDLIRSRINEEKTIAEGAAHELQDGFDETRSWLLSLKHELSSTQSAKVRLDAEIASLISSEGSDFEDVAIEPIESERDDVLKRLAAKSNDAEQATDRLSESEARADQARIRTNDAERRLQSLVEAEALRTRRSENLEPDREKYSQQLEAGRVLVQELDERVKANRAQIMETVEKRKELLAESQAKLDESRSAQKAASATSDILHQSELKRARADSKRSAAVERLVEEYGIVEDEALLMAGQFDIPEDAAVMVSQMRKELKAMGDVNVGAIEAFERLNERHQELFGQVEDIEGGMSEIQASIKEMDRLTKEKFVATFDKIRDAFAETFVKLFGGGAGSLELSEGENILESGVDIAVTIPGKKQQRLELLSGGERAMSALAFLFSLLKVKPSPLVILDEVDAPLDGRNVERFVNMMREFNQDSQFILITHNPVTIESADVWFGVTMQEPGVSTLVPFKVPPKATVSAGMAVVSGEAMTPSKG